MHKIIPFSQVAVTETMISCEWLKWLSVLQSQAFSKYRSSADFLMQSNFLIQCHCIPLNNI